MEYEDSKDKAIGILKKYQEAVSVKDHWREKFEGEVCTQVFFHYNKKGSKNIYDGRARLGLPSDIKKK